MRKIQNIAFVLLATLFAGCINDHIENALCRDGVLSLNLSTGATTRTDTPNNGYGEGTNDNTPRTESAIKDIQFFLYPDGSTDGVNATFAGRIDVTATDTTEQTVTVPADAISTLCPNPGDECDIYVIVNYYEQMKEDLTTADDTSRATLKDKALSTTFFNTNGSFVPQSFVMDSEVFSVTRGTDNNSNKLTSETIYVTRAAAKILIEVTVQSTVDVSGVKWEALTDVNTSNPYYMSLDFFNGVKDGVIDDNSDTNPAGKDIRPASTAEGYNPYYHIENVMMTSGSVGSDITNPDTSAVTRAETVKFVPMTPLYSYTSSWSDNDEDAPYFKLSIPWRKIVEGQDDNAAWVTYDYTVPISLKTNQLVRNKLYLIRLNVGALGDLDYLDPAVYSYVVLDWEDVSMNAELTRPKYFVVKEEYVEIYNEPSYIVDFSATDIVTAEILRVIKPDYSGKVPKEDNDIFGSANNTNGVTTFSPSSGNTNPFTLVVDNDTDDGDGKSITLTHTLDNDMNSDGFDYVPYTVVVRATMTITDSAGNTSTMVKDITFKQYPAIYLYADTNASFKSEDSDNAVNNNPANTFVNGWNRRTTQGGSESIAPGVTITNNTNPTMPGTVWGLYATSNSNPNQYVVTISSLDSSLPYIIADPRSRTSDVSSLNIGTIATSYAVDYDFNLATNKRQMQNYYRTNDSRTDGSTTASNNPNEYITAYHIAPKYRIASSYSVTTGVNSLDIARQRCATYQENGYPAGRWRMPTYAEVAFICLMSNKGMIPDLFDDNTSYWCAHGQFYPSGGEVKLGGNGATSIRCVYDEWYWGSERLSTDTSVTPNYSQFVWGDMKIW
ncbi:MAG: hypothetical protein IJ942_06665 [Alistipes sp.]|nr:hypothetical protein [Alistipes sp.]MBR2116684.1 hypothetical protein [Alistipes sp.]MBR3590588.1 hypothetical protein [Alistipes sp.]